MANSGKSNQSPALGGANEAARFRLFLGCFVSLIATAFGFAVRGAILGDLQSQYGLSNEQLGYLGGVGLFPFAISIILWSLVIDKVGYGRAMAFAFFAHLGSVILTITAKDFTMLYWATFLAALANGTVEAVINPVVASIYSTQKTKYLNILHAGWPGGLVLGGLLAIGISNIQFEDTTNIWRWQMALVLLPTIAYGVLLMGQKFPAQERVSAGVSYMDMLKEFGWGSAYICSALLIAGISQILLVVGAAPLSWPMIAAIAIVPTIAFAIPVKSFGRPMFVFLLLVMCLLATTELGTDSWISDIMRAVLGSQTLGILFLVYTSAIMFVLRFFAGPIVHRISPLGLLAVCAAIAAIGLYWLGNAGTGVGVLFLAATFYAFGKTFFWPTTLGVVSEQYPKGGALMINAIAGVGMIAVGTIGGPGIGFFQDKGLADSLKTDNVAVYEQVMKKDQDGMFGKLDVLDQEKLKAADDKTKQLVEHEVMEAKQGTLAKVAILPAIMLICYLGLIAYFKSKGGYKAAVLTGHAAEDAKFTGGVEGPVE